MRGWRNLLALGALGAVFLGVTLAYSLSTPPFEGFDEPHHLAYVERLAEGRGLPPLPGAYFEGHQPPLFYLVAAAVVNVDHLPLPPAARNRLRGDPPALVYRHDRDPPCGACGWVLTIRLLRALGAIFGLVTVALCYLVAREVLGGGPPALAAAAFVALLPQFDFMHAIVNNDALAFTTGNLALLGCVVVVASRDGTRRLGGAVCAGVGMGLGLLTKEYALAMLPLLPLAAFYGRTGLRRLAFLSLAGLAVAAIVAAPWLLHNLGTYHVLWPFAQERANIAASLPLSVTNRGVTEVLLDQRLFPVLWASFWFSGGHGQVNAPDAFYAVLVLACIPPALGVLRLLRGRRSLPGPLGPDGLRRALLYLCAAMLLEFTAIVYSNLSVHQFQGRYFFPLLGGIATLQVAGWPAVLPERRARPARWVPATVCAVASIYALLAVLRPAFQSIL